MPRGLKVGAGKKDLETEILEEFAESATRRGLGGRPENIEFGELAFDHRSHGPSRLAKRAEQREMRRYYLRKWVRTKGRSWREHCNTYQNERRRRHLADPILRERFLAQKRKGRNRLAARAAQARYEERLRADPERRAADLERRREKARERRAAKRMEERGVRRCSGCRRPGHNRRTCPVDAITATTPEEQATRRLKASRAYYAANRDAVLAQQREHRRTRRKGSQS